MTSTSVRISASVSALTFVSPADVSPGGASAAAAARLSSADTAWFPALR